jgi:hypothetical protein
MIKTAKGITDAEIEQAAAYFSGLKPRATIKVAETATVPNTRVAGWFLAAVPGGESEPIAGRIIEVPADLSGLKCATRDRNSSPTCRRAVSKRADNSRQPAATARARASTPGQPSGAG